MWPPGLNNDGILLLPCGIPHHGGMVNLKELPFPQLGEFAIQPNIAYKLQLKITHFHLFAKAIKPSFKKNATTNF